MRSRAWTDLAGRFARREESADQAYIERPPNTALEPGIFIFRPRLSVQTNLLRETYGDACPPEAVVNVNNVRRCRTPPVEKHARADTVESIYRFLRVEQLTSS